MNERHFLQGWRDRLKRLPPRASYERKRTLPRVQYERGRHVAAMWEFYVTTEQRRGYRFGTINGAENPLDWQFQEAFHLMPAELVRSIYAEEAFCSLQSELLVGVQT